MSFQWRYSVRERNWPLNLIFRQRVSAIKLLCQPDIGLRAVFSEAGLKKMLLWPRSGFHRINLLVRWTRLDLTQ